VVNSDCTLPIFVGEGDAVNLKETRNFSKLAPLTGTILFPTLAPFPTTGAKARILNQTDRATKSWRAFAGFFGKSAVDLRPKQVMV
jgi:hypothetical protein